MMVPFSIGRVLDFHKGTVVANGKSTTYLWVHVVIYRKDKSYFHTDIDVKDYVLSKSQRTHITD